MSVVLEARSVTVVHEGKRVVDAASITLDEGAIATIQGASGSGKSTLLRALVRLVRLASGEVLYRGTDAAALEATELRRRVAWVPQLPRMFEGSVADNLRAGPAFAGRSVGDADVSAQLQRVGLAPALASRRADVLSGGERLRVALARALANAPEVLLLDEPTSALDAASAALVLDLLASLAERGMSLLVVTHVDAHAGRLGGRRHAMQDGVLRSCEDSG